MRVANPRTSCSFHRSPLCAAPFVRQTSPSSPEYKTVQYRRMSTGISRFEYVLGDLSLGHNTEKTIRVLNQKLSGAGHADAASIVSSLHEDFKSLNIQAKAFLVDKVRQEQSDENDLDYNESIAAVMSGEARLEDDSVAVWAEVAELQEQAMQASSGGANNNVNLGTSRLNSLIRQRRDLQKRARILLDAFTVARSSHPAWGSSAGRNLIYTVSASTLPQDEAEFDRSWRLSVDGELSRRARLQQDASQEYLMLMSAHDDSQSWSPDERSALHTCVRGLLRLVLTLYNPSLTTFPVVDLDADASIAARSGTPIVRWLALVTENGQYTLEDRVSVFPE